MLHSGLILAAAAIVLSPQAHAQYSLVDAFPALPAFSIPVELVNAGDGTDRLFVVEQRGRIYVFHATDPAERDGSS